MTTNNSSIYINQGKHNPMSRLATRFEQLKSQHRKALVSYVMAGDPHPQVTVPLLHQMVEAGVDVVELGFPGKHDKFLKVVYTGTATVTTYIG
jgi:mono/diheme cytochrome c family protein